MRASCFSLENAFRRTDAMGSLRVQLRLAIMLLVLAPALIRASAQVQDQQLPNSDSKGTFLIARRTLSDPFFAKSTVLVLPVERYPLVVGLIINKPTKIKLKALFPHAHNVEEQDATAYFGGPVDIHDRSAIFRSRTRSKNALHVFADVYVTFDSDAIDELVNRSRRPSALRIFLGRSQWSRPQLEHEMLAGAWYKYMGNADPIFATDPGKVWEELLGRAAPSPYADHLPLSMRTGKTVIYSGSCSLASAD